MSKPCRRCAGPRRRFSPYCRHCRASGSLVPATVDGIEGHDGGHTFTHGPFSDPWVPPATVEVGERNEGGHVDLTSLLPPGASVVDLLNGNLT